MHDITPMIGEYSEDNNKFAHQKIKQNLILHRYAQYFQLWYRMIVFIGILKISKVFSNSEKII